MRGLATPLLGNITPSLSARGIQTSRPRVPPVWPSWRRRGWRRCCGRLAGSPRRGGWSSNN